MKNDATGRVVALAVDLAQEAAAGNNILASREAPATRKRGADDYGGSSDAGPRDALSSGASLLFAKTGTKLHKAKTDRFASPGIFRKVISSDVPEKTIVQQAHRELADLRGLNAGSLCADLSSVKTLQWWSTFQHDHPMPARVARVVYGPPASAAVIEHYFSDAGRMMTSTRSTIDGAFVEMIDTVSPWEARPHASACP